MNATLTSQMNIITTKVFWGGYTSQFYDVNEDKVSQEENV